MNFNFKSFSFILSGCVILGISLGVVLGAFLEKNELNFLIYSSAFLASIGSGLVIIGAFSKNDNDWFNRKKNEIIKW